MLQIGVCKITVIDKCIEYQCSFFLVTGNGSVLLGMPAMKDYSCWAYMAKQTINKREDKYTTMNTQI